MPTGLIGVKLTIYNEDGSENENQYVMVEGVTEAEVTVQKLKFAIYNAADHTEFASRIVAAQAFKEAVEAFE